MTTSMLDAGTPVRRQAAKRCPAPCAEEQPTSICTTGDAYRVLDAVPFPGLLINAERVVEYANAAAAEFLQLPAASACIGKTPGSVLQCIHADETPGGCGTTKYCTQCGASAAIRTAQLGASGTGECRIMTAVPGQDLDLRVWSRPAAGNRTLLTMMNIADEKRRAALESIFFHDVLNTAGGIQGAASLCPLADPEEREQLTLAVGRLASRLVEELTAQRDLAAMEQDALVSIRQPVSADETVGAIVELYRHHDVAEGRSITVVPGPPVSFPSDARLLRRVLGNMVKNALEACPSGGVVTVGHTVTGTRIQFSVHNPTPMPREVQLQVFQRSFSTKGCNRGLGTYSMRLLSERYLGGRVSFTTSPEAGTTFIAEYERRP